MDNNWLVYRHVFPNGKIYIGKTKNDQKHRFANGNGYKRNREMYHDVKKYGWENVKHEILISGITELEAMIVEPDCIEYYATTLGRDRLYNKNSVQCKSGAKTDVPPEKRLAAEKLKKMMGLGGVEQWVSPLPPEGTSVAQMVDAANTIGYAVCLVKNGARQKEYLPIRIEAESQRGKNSAQDKKTVGAKGEEN